MDAEKLKSKLFQKLIDLAGSDEDYAFAVMGMVEKLIDMAVKKEQQVIYGDYFDLFEQNAAWRAVAARLLNVPEAFVTCPEDAERMML